MPVSQWREEFALCPFGRMFCKVFANKFACQEFWVPGDDVVLCGAEWVGFVANLSKSYGRKSSKIIKW